MTLLDYHGLLIAANLAYLPNDDVKDGALMMRPKKWKIFFDQSDFVKDGVEVEKNVRKFDLRA